MNCSWIILLLLFCGQNGNFLSGGSNNGSNGGCDRPQRPPMPPVPPCREPAPEPCPCEDSRFEPRFEARPYNGNGSTCGCEGENN